MKKCLQKLNDNILANQWVEAIPCWFSIRVNMASTVAMFLIGVFCITARFSQNPIMLAMLLSYMLML